MIDGWTIRLNLKHKPLNLQPRLDRSGELSHFRSETCPIIYGLGLVEAKSVGHSLTLGREADQLLLSWNPAKCSQGHNLFGTNDVQMIVRSIKDILERLGIQTRGEELRAIEAGEFNILKLDINFPIWFRTDQEADRWLTLILKTGSTKQGYMPWPFKSSVYFGSAKDKRYKEIRIYNKHQEWRSHKKQFLQHTAESAWNQLSRFSIGMIRFEVSYRTKWLQNNRLDRGVDWFGPDTIVSRLESEFSNLNLPLNVPVENGRELELSNALRITYELWRSGTPSMRALLSESKFKRHRRELLLYGIDIREPPHLEAFSVEQVAGVLDFQGLPPTWAEEVTGTLRPEQSVDRNVWKKRSRTFA